MLPALPLIMGGLSCSIISVCHSPGTLFHSSAILEISLKALREANDLAGGRILDCRSIRANTLRSFLLIVIVPFNGKHP